MKDVLKSHLELHAFDPQLSINIYADAAKIGSLGFVLIQPDPEEDRREHVMRLQRAL